MSKKIEEKFFIETLNDEQNTNLSQKDRETLIKNCNLEQYKKTVSRPYIETNTLKSFFGNSNIFIISEDLSSYLHNLLQFNMNVFFAQEKFSRICDISIKDGEFITQSRKSQVQYENDKFFDAYVEAYVFYKNDKNKKICIKIERRYSSNMFCYEIFSTEENCNLWQKWKEYSRINNFYRGKKINADCSFLRLDNKITWDDIIIEPDTKKVIENNIEKFFSVSDMLKKNSIKLKRGIILSGSPGTGKAQPLDSLVFTPNGPRTMGSLCIGDDICTPSGNISKIIGIYPQGIKEIYKIIFTNGDKVECCLDHLWKIRDKCRSNRTMIVDTKYLLENFKPKNKMSNNCNYNCIRIELPKPLYFNEQPVDLDPYLMGVLLGDGSTIKSGVMFSTADLEILESVKEIIKKYNLSVKHASKYDYRISSTLLVGRDRYKKNQIQKALELYKIWGLKSIEKFIPKEYLYNSIEVRSAILQGLMDTDGYVEGTKRGYGTPTFCTSSPQLANDIKELVESLGGVVRTSIKKKPKYTYRNECKTGLPAYILCIQIDEPKRLFRLQRKIELTKNRIKYHPTRIISDIEVVGKKEAQCIMIDDPQHLYLTNHCIATHNTLCAKILAKELNATIIYVLPTHIRDKSDIASICDMAKDLAPTLLILEDIDYIAEDRESHNGWAVIDLMNKMDGLEGFDNVITLATTNLISKVEDAIKNRPGRFDRVITLDNPSTNLKIKMLKKFTEHLIVDNDVNFTKIIKNTKGLSGAYIKDLSVTASLIALYEDSISKDQIIILKQKHFEEALKEINNKDFSQAATNQPSRMGFGFGQEDEECSGK